MINNIPLLKDNVIILRFVRGGKSAIVKENEIISHDEFYRLIDNNFNYTQAKFFRDPSSKRHFINEIDFSNYLLVCQNKTSWMGKEMTIEDFQYFMNIQSPLFDEMLMWSNDFLRLPFKKNIHKKYGILLG